MRIIEVVQYDNNWLYFFELEKQLLVSSFSIKNMLVHHIDSNSVSGLAAKPVIDIMLEVRNLEILDRHNEIFESIGYECKGQNLLPR